MSKYGKASQSEKKQAKASRWMVWSNSATDDVPSGTVADHYLGLLRLGNGWWNPHYSQQWFWLALLIRLGGDLNFLKKEKSTILFILS